MKKAIALLFAMITLVVVFSLGTTYADTSDKNPDGTYLLPSLLLEIEEEAFSGTDVQTVILPYNFLYIGENAFQGASSLSDAYIPPTTEYIADSAFPENADFVIHGVEDSYAQDWAEEHKVSFIVENIWKSMLDDGKTVSGRQLGMDFRYRTINPERTIQLYSRSDDYGESKRPQDRPELNPIDYRFP